MLINTRTESFTVIHSFVLLTLAAYWTQGIKNRQKQLPNPLQGQLALLVALCVLPLKTDGGTLKKYSSQNRTSVLSF